MLFLLVVYIFFLSMKKKACPYLGKAMHDFLEFKGKVYGFCNPRCRDKTIIDPEAGPAFMALAT